MTGPSRPEHRKKGGKKEGGRGKGEKETKGGGGGRDEKEKGEKRYGKVILWQMFCFQRDNIKFNTQSS